MKKNGGWPPLLALCALLWDPAAAHGQHGQHGQQPLPRVLLLQPDPPPPHDGLADALRIQLRGVATVEQATGPAPGPLPRQVRATSARAEARGALLSVWVQRPPPQDDGEAREAVLYLVGRREGRALLEVVRVPGGGGPALDRSLALKVREVVDSLQRAEAERREALLSPPPPPRPEPHRQLGLHAAAVGAPLQGASLGQWGAQLGVLGALQWAPHRVEAELGATLFPSVGVAEGPREARLTELSARLSIAWLHALGPAHVGARAGLTLGTVQVEGRTPDGRTGEATEVAPGALLLAEARISLGDPGPWLQLWLGAQARLTRRRYTIEGEEVADLGRLRPLLALGLGHAFDTP
ncbi:MAG: hypothetical protein PVI30_10595 [Myxococcales bacterium]